MEQNGGFESRFDVTTTMKLVLCNNQSNPLKQFLDKQTCLDLLKDNPTQSGGNGMILIRYSSRYCVTNWVD